MNDSTPQPAAKFSLARVLVIVVPIVLVAVVVVGVIYSGGDLGFGSGKPKLGRVEGKVLMRGKPMPGVMIQTTYVDNPAFMGGIATTGDDGTFVLETDADGELVEGLFVGKHKVTVTKYLPGPGVGYGPMVTPADYSSMGSTPLEFVVESSDNNFEIVLEVDEDTPTEEFIEQYLKERAEASAQPSPPRFNPNAPDNGGAAPPGGGFDPAAFFADRDADGDGKLAGDEIPERMQERVTELDTDGDGAISKEEFDAAGPPAGRGGRGGRGGGAAAEGSGDDQ